MVPVGLLKQLLGPGNILLGHVNLLHGIFSSALPKETLDSTFSEDSFNPGQVLIISGIVKSHRFVIPYCRTIVCR